jgi:hypothetical protein
MPLQALLASLTGNGTMHVQQPGSIHDQRLAIGSRHMLPPKPRLQGHSIVCACWAIFKNSISGCHCHIVVGNVLELLLMHQFLLDFSPLVL